MNRTRRYSRCEVLAARCKGDCLPVAGHVFFLSEAREEFIFWQGVKFLYRLVNNLGQEK